MDFSNYRVVHAGIALEEKEGQPTKQTRQEVGGRFPEVRQAMVRWRADGHCIRDDDSECANGGERAERPSRLPVLNSFD